MHNSTSSVLAALASSSLWNRKSGKATTGRTGRARHEIGHSIPVTQQRNGLPHTELTSKVLYCVPRVYAVAVMKSCSERDLAFFP
ncbi:hypothetical protein P389DRAFT_171509 [Cystobasidium minutum MCA 4210]|uniref:uncharacterized protein n=1 Tax=Cystobasidium minutum MCA 4210 TaxID=1397322 RepID=UPI0034CDE75C|eukprot:jgi/Rhomi1/171509/fgenesh1_kg.4_\